MRYKVILLLTLLASIVSIIAFFLISSRARVTSENYSRVVEGMSETTVEGLLGPGEQCVFVKKQWPERPGTPKSYMGNDLWVLVWYDDGGFVLSKEEFPCVEIRPRRSWIFRFLREVVVSLK